MDFVDSRDLSNGREGETSTLPSEEGRRSRAALPRQFSRGDLVAGRFRVRRFLGQGGMAQVYEAEDLELGQRVAIKVLRPDVARGVRAARLLKTEVLLARRVTHPNVCRTFEVFQHCMEDPDGTPGTVLVVAMELLAGETLAARLRRGSFAPAEALPLIRQMAAGLAAAHEAGVAHLDLKSGNVLLVSSRDGVHAVITDFGLARNTQQQDDPAASSSARVAGGTPAYMAPEQVAGEEVTASADLYALGVVVYEMVTGRLPFPGEDPHTNALRRLREPPPPPRLYVPDLDPRWNRAILRCLERDPARRFGSAAELVSALGEPSPGLPAGQHSHWRRVAVVCLILSLLASLAYLLPTQPAGTSPGAPAAPHLAADATAWQLYERGLAALRASEAPEATRLLERAVAIDPAFCRAHSALADAWLELGYRLRAKRHAQRAFELSADLPREERLWVEARYHQAHGRWDAAIERYQALWTFFPDNLEYALYLAEAQALVGRTRQSLATLAALRRSPSTSADPRIDLAEAAAVESSDYRRQLAAATRAAQRAEALENWRLVGRSRLIQGQAWRELGELERARSAMTAARAAYLRAGDRAGVAKVAYQSAITAYRFGHQPAQAERLLAEAGAIYRDIGDRAGEGKVLRRHAHLAALTGRLDEARSRLIAALAVFREIGVPEEEANARVNLAEVLGYQGHLAESARQLEVGLSVVRASGTLEGEAYILRALANRVRHWDLAQGLRFLEEAAAICDRTGNAPCSASSAMELGSARRDAGDFESAEESLAQARAIYQTMDSRLVTEVQMELARSYLEQGRGSAAASLASAAVRSYSSAEMREDEGFAWALLAEALATDGSSEEAARALERAREMLPDIQIRETALRSSIMQARALHALGRPAEAAELLRRAEADASTIGSASLRIEAALARTMIEPKGMSDCGSLIALEAEAKAHHFGLLATKAATARRACERPL